MKSSFLTLLMIFLSINLKAQNLSSRKNINEVIDYRFKSVIKITVLDKDLKTLTQGAGFYLGPDGLLLTSDHIIKEFLNNDSNKIQFKNFEGKFLSSINLLGCKNSKNIDACLLSDESKKKRPYFPISMIKIGRGHQVAMIGFCDSDQHSSKRGLIVDYFEDINSKFSTSKEAYNQKTKMVQTDVSQCPGDSGGPLFNYSGELVGMATNIFKSNKGEKQFNLSIHNNELVGFIKNLKSKKKLIAKERILSSSIAKAKLLKLIK